MNRIFAAWGVFLVTAGLCAAGFFHTQSSVRELERLTQRTESASGNLSQAADCAGALLDAWGQAHGALSLYLSHARLDALDEAFSSLPVLAQDENWGEFRVECRRAQLLLRRLRESELPLPENILFVAIPGQPART